MAWLSPLVISYLLLSQSINNFRPAAPLKCCGRVAPLSGGPAINPEWGWGIVWLCYPGYKSGTRHPHGGSQSCAPCYKWSHNLHWGAQEYQWTTPRQALHHTLTLLCIPPPRSGGRGRDTQGKGPTCLQFTVSRLQSLCEWSDLDGFLDKNS